MTTDTDEPQPAEPATASRRRHADRAPAASPAESHGESPGPGVGRVPVGRAPGGDRHRDACGHGLRLGNPNAGAAPADHRMSSSAGAPDAGGPAASGFISDASEGGSGDSAGEASKLNVVAAPAGTATTTEVDQLTATLESNQIVKTGSMALEVTDLDRAVFQAQSTIEGMGGNVSQSSSSGDKDSAVATVEYRVPVARWDDALAAMRALGTKVISEQTNSTDATAQLVDLDARISNLQATQSALQSIMARASAIPDVLAVEQQLSDTEGQIEELSAQQALLKNQAAMSTLTVSFSTPGETDTTQAAEGWDLGAQIDQAAATLVYIGQGLVTILVWAVVVGLPLAMGLALLWAIWKIGRRLARGQRRPVVSA